MLNELSVLTLHHLHLLPQRHPQAPGGGVCQEAPGFFISWFSRNTILWFLLMLLQHKVPVSPLLDMQIRTTSINTQVQSIVFCATFMSPGGGFS